MLSMLFTHAVSGEVHSWRHFSSRDFTQTSVVNVSHLYRHLKLQHVENSNSMADISPHCSERKRKCLVVIICNLDVTYIFPSRQQFI